MFFPVLSTLLKINGNWWKENGRKRKTNFQLYWRSTRGYYGSMAYASFTFNSIEDQHVLILQLAKFKVYNFQLYWRSTSSCRHYHLRIHHITFNSIEDQHDIEKRYHLVDEFVLSTLLKINAKKIHFRKVMTNGLTFQLYWRSTTPVQEFFRNLNIYPFNSIEDQLNTAPKPKRSVLCLSTLLKINIIKTII